MQEADQNDVKLAIEECRVLLEKYTELSDTEVCAHRALSCRLVYM